MIRPRKNISISEKELSDICILHFSFGSHLEDKGKLNREAGKAKASDN